MQAKKQEVLYIDCGKNPFRYSLETLIHPKENCSLFLRCFPLADFSTDDFLSNASLWSNGKQMSFKYQVLHNKKRKEEWYRSKDEEENRYQCAVEEFNRKCKQFMYGKIDYEALKWALKTTQYNK